MNLEIIIVIISTMDYKQNQCVNPGTNRDWFFFCRDAQQAETYRFWICDASNNGLKGLAKISKV